MSHTQLIIRVKGRVQGVGFRYFTYQKATQLNLTGYVKNLTNGDVEIVASGSQDTLESFLAWLQQGGPPSAKISHIESAPLDDASLLLHSFTVKH